MGFLHRWQLNFTPNKTIDRTMQDRSHFNNLNKGKNWSKGGQGFGWGMILVLPLLGSPVLAQTPPDPNAPIPNPLELTQPDPLLPEGIINRPLSSPEKDVLRTALEQLQAEAAAKLQTGDIPGALDILNRELRLRRFLGSAEEVAALSRVGAVAWRESQITELRFITERLQQIEQQVSAQPDPNPNLLLKIAEAYTTVRAKAQAGSLYDKLLAQAQQQQNLNRQEQILTEMGQLHLAWFDYANAATAYEQLVTVAQAKSDRVAQAKYLEQLARIYQENRQPDQAIATNQKLVDLYQQQRNFEPIPALKLAIGDQYAVLGRTDLAVPSYQEAFAAARSVQQYAYASDALQRLATLYQADNRIDEALATYRLLLDVEQQSYNTVGLMDTYDQIGQMLKARGDNSQALAAFRQGLQLAQQLKYKVDYFTAQIQAVSQ
ncbi:MAG TPA: hypothetical protein V6D10_25060 [Trichocoleus sp.]|jgi:tetratricopeptide (TPR) repeat protein